MFHGADWTFVTNDAVIMPKGHGR